MHCYTSGLGSSPVARHYWGNHCYFLFLEVLRCFSSLRSPLYFGKDNSPSDYWVVPFGNLWIKGYLHLPKAYRSLSRPSSPPWAKASAMRPFLLSPKFKVKSKSEKWIICCRHKDGQKTSPKNSYTGERQQIIHFSLYPITLDCSYFQLLIHII